MVVFFHAQVSGDPTHSLEPRVALGRRRGFGGPADHSLRANVCFVTLLRNVREAAQQIVGARQFEAGGTPRFIARRL